MKLLPANVALGLQAIAARPGLVCESEEPDAVRRRLHDEASPVLLGVLSRAAAVKKKPTVIEPCPFCCTT